MIRWKRENHNDLRRTNRPSVIELQRHRDLDFLRDRLLTPRRSILTLPRRAKIMVCHQTDVRSKIAIFSMVRGTVEEWIVKSKSEWKQRYLCIYPAVSSRSIKNNYP